ncbi:hydroxymethylglutaryl-CoA lyase [Micrococcus luteus]|uniref:hydroxymethylglutaryl-CoA lyase n=1 Tax=Micrococcus luteus TaxID=1270 RepID=UPI00378967DD
MARVEVTDVFLRDGIQDEPVLLTPAQRVEIGEAVAAAGVPRLEVASFVNPARVPQMAGAEEVLAGLAARVDAELTVLTLNGRGVDRAVAAGAEHVQIVTSASEEHSAANAGRSVDAALADLAGQVAAHPGTDFVAGVSTAFTYPVDTLIGAEQLLRVVRAFRAMGVRTIGLADTLGTTSTADLMAAVDHVLDAEPDLAFSLHLHDALGQALDTVDAALERGIVRFDAALGGYGGCPFAPGAAGNLSTGELVRHLHERGHETGIDEDRLAEATALARSIMAAAPAAPATAHA